MGSHLSSTFDQSTTLVDRISKVFSKYLDLAKSAEEQSQIETKHYEASQEEPTQSK